MWFTRALVVLGLTLAIGASTADAEKPGQAGNKQKRKHAVHGVVVNVVKDRDKDSGTITVRVHQGKKGNAAASAPVERKFHVTSATKFEKLLIEGKGKGEREHKPATFAEVHRGEHVLIVPVAGDAD